VNGSVSADTAICPGNTVSLSASGGTTYAWSTGDTTSTIVVNPLSTTVYTVLISDNNGCTLSRSVTVTVNQGNPVSIGGNDTQYVCLGNSVQLNVGGASTYTWSPTTGLDNPNSSSPLATPLISTMYKVVGVSVDGCTSIDSVFVEVVAPTSIQLIPVAALCANQSPVPLQAIPVGGTFGGVGVSNGQFDPASVGAGSFTVEYLFVDAFGCSTTATQAITVNPVPTADAGPDQTVCYGTPVSLVAGGGVSYLWSTGETTASIQVNPSNSIDYWVIATNQEGCSDSDFVSVFVNPIPVITFLGDTNLCEGESTQISLSGGSSYQWSPVTGVSNPVSGNPILSPAVTTTYTVTGVDGNGCEGSAQITILVNPPHSVNAGIDQVYCGNSVTLSASSSTNGLTYTWSNGDTGANIQVSPNATTSYIVTGTNQFGCASYDTVVVYVPSAFAGGSQSTCLGGSVQLSGAISQYPFTGSLVYQWSPSTGLDNPSISNPVATPSASTTYTLTIITPEGCSLTANTSVNISPTPVIQLGSDITLAPNTSIQLVPGLSQIATGRTVAWTFLGNNPNGSLNLSSVVNPTFTANQVTTATTTYWVLTVVNPNGCSGTDTIGITVDPALSGYTISGRLAYDNISSSPVNQGWAILLDSAGTMTVDSVALSPSGTYLFVGVANGNYRLTSTTTKPYGGITTADASLINSYALGLGGLSGMKLQAANVTEVGGANIILGNDAQQTARRAADLSVNASFGNGGPGDWLHDTVDVSINGQSAVRNLKAISYGDVNGSYSPVLRNTSPIILEKEGEIHVDKEGNYSLPLVALENYLLGSFQFVLKLPSADQLVAATIPGLNDPIYINQVGNSVFLGWYTTTGVPVSFKSGSSLLNLKFKHSTLSLPRNQEFDIQLGSQSELAGIDGSSLSNGKVGVPNQFKIGMESDQDFVLFPNPTKSDGPLYLNIPQKLNSGLRIQICDLVGRRLTEDLLMSETTGNRMNLSDLKHDLPPGTYLIDILTTDKTANQPISTRIPLVITN
jgi:hypothetical protein